MTVDELINTIIVFIQNRKLVEKRTNLIITIDHVLLTSPSKQNEDEKSIIDRLMKSLVNLKKIINSMGINVIFIVLSQLNREIESYERVNNPFLHYPSKRDLFAASSTYYCSDYVLVLHRPASVVGMGNFYGPPTGEYKRGLPVFHPKTKEVMIYGHVIKNRFYKPVVISFVDNFHKAMIAETSL